jgi:uncharacterized protein YfbU (UPF0304 family)
MDYNNKKLKEKCKYIVRNMFIYRAVYTEWVSLSSCREAQKINESRPKPLGFIMAIYFYIESISS